MSFINHHNGQFDLIRDGLGYKTCILFARKTRTLSQDRGDTIDLDKKEQEQAQIAGGMEMLQLLSVKCKFQQWTLTALVS